MVVCLCKRGAWGLVNSSTILHKDGPANIISYDQQVLVFDKYVARRAEEFEQYRFAVSRRVERLE